MCVTLHDRIRWISLSVCFRGNLEDVLQSFSSVVFACTAVEFVHRVLRTAMFAKPLGRQRVDAANLCVRHVKCDSLSVFPRADNPLGKLLRLIATQQPSTVIQLKLRSVRRLQREESA